MTVGTGKRISRACLRCRRRKTKCNLDGVGEPKKPPCETCHNSNSECILVESRRGAFASGNRRRKSSNLKTSEVSKKSTGGENQCHSTGSTDDHENPMRSASSTAPRSPSNQCTNSNQNGNQLETDEDDEDLHMALRNPSDALHILSHAKESPQNQRLNEDQRSTPNTRASEPDSTYERRFLGSSAAPQDVTTGESNRTRNAAPSTLLDDYELVQRGLIHPAVVPELLNIFARHYHPYCSIVPLYMLGAEAMTKIQRPDYFLLTVILAVASRDSTDHILTHRYCWDHIERLLLGVLLAHPWAQTARTVQALLLLAEWLPFMSKPENSTSSTSLLRNDQSAWSIVGLAVRQGYLLRLDRGAFPNVGDRDLSGREEEEERRLTWTFIYLADRQISVRMGQSFWSRGPSLSSTLTAQDFPNLKALPGSGDGDYALVMQANLELTQILYGAHGILYSSTKRTLAMVHDGDYARYLDDFQGSAMTWYMTWRDIRASENIRTSLFLLYEYVCLYVNAFSFQAVLTRTAGTQIRGQDSAQSGTRCCKNMFPNGLMASPDGPYIYEAIASARKILSLFAQQSPQDMLRYLPTRYHLYGVYAAVFLHKAQRVGAFQSDSQKQENITLARLYISKLEQTSMDEMHLCRRYGAMLSKIWYQASNPHSLNQDELASQRQQRLESFSSFNNSNEAPAVNVAEPRMSWSNDHSKSDGQVPENRQSVQVNWGNGMMGLNTPSDIMQQGNDQAMAPDLDAYFFGPFDPGVMDIDFSEGFGGSLTL